MTAKPTDGPLDPVNGSLLDLRIAAGSICRTGNGYAAANELIVEAEKDWIRYKNGKTLRASAKRLMADARSGARHSVILSRNMWRPGKVDQLASQRTTLSPGGILVRIALAS